MSARRPALSDAARRAWGPDAARHEIPDNGRSGLVGVYERYDYGAETAAALLRWQEHVAQLVGVADVAPASAKEDKLV
jgi:hypothetical protein